MVREKAILRSLINVSTEVIAECYEHTEDVEELLDRAERMMFEISEQRVNAAFANLKELLKDSIRYTEQLYERHELITGLPSGFRDFDQITAGLQPSDLIIIAARPGMGKTAFALNIARNAGMRMREPRQAVAVFSLEMSKEQLALRMLCAEARIDSSRLRRGYLDKQEWGRLVNAANDLSDTPVFIDDTPCTLSSGHPCQGPPVTGGTWPRTHHYRLSATSARPRTHRKSAAGNLRNQPLTESSGQRAQGSRGRALPAQPGRGTAQRSYAATGRFT